MNRTKKLTALAMCLAAGLVLPAVFRAIPKGGMLFSPMHISPLLAGLAIGPVEGAIVGVLCPILNSVLSGMPQGNTLIGMCFELPVYGIVAGCMMRMVSTKKAMAEIYISLIVAMVAGRIVGGMVQGFLLDLGNYSLQMWVTSYFISTFPGIILHLLLIPAVCMALRKAGFRNR